MKLIDKMRKDDEKFFDEKQISDQGQIFKLSFFVTVIFQGLLVLLAEAGVPFNPVSASHGFVIPVVFWLYLVIGSGAFDGILPRKMMKIAAIPLLAVLIAAAYGIIGTARNLLGQDPALWDAEKWIGIALAAAAKLMGFGAGVFFLIRCLRSLKSGADGE